MAEVIKIRKGLDIRLNGEAEKVYVKAPRAKTFAIKPSDWHGLTPKIIPKLCDPVKIGTPIFYDKYNPEVKFTSPVSGIMSEINRGERRRIIEVRIEDDGKDTAEEFQQGDPSGMSREKIVENLLESGLWPVLRKRPYTVIARPDETPKAIFISAFDSAPLAPDYDFLLKDMEDDFQWGVNVLKRLTEGKVHLNLDGRNTGGISLATRSVFRLVEILSAAVEVPEQDQGNGTTADYPAPGPIGRQLRIRRAKTRPEHATVAVEYRDGWFYIDDTDRATKGFFRLLGTLWSVAVAESAARSSAAPILTLPASR